MRAIEIPKELELKATITWQMMEGCDEAANRRLRPTAQLTNRPQYPYRVRFAAGTKQLLLLPLRKQRIEPERNKHRRAPTHPDLGKFRSSKPIRGQHDQLIQMRTVK